MERDIRYYFDDFVARGKNAFHSVCDRASDLTETTKTKGKISDLKVSIKRKQRMLGMLACDVMEQGELTFTPDMQDLYNEIYELQKQIDALGDLL